MKKEKNKALVLFSGGLDSRLTIKLLQEQNLDVESVFIQLPSGGGCCNNFSCIFNFSQVQGVKLHVIDCNKGKLFKEYLDLVKNPKHGTGTAMNPCKDCKIFLFKQAKKLAKKINADIIATGEVLGQRPMSQLKDVLLFDEKEAGLENKILRPLSAKLLPLTDYEKNDMIDRNKLLAISGRSRKIQMALAKKYKIDYPSPGGGCLLCEKEYCNKLQDLFKYNKTLKFQDIQFLKGFRHFRAGKSKIIVGRNKAENKMLFDLKKKSDYFFEVVGIGSPITILQGSDIKTAAALAARYSDAKDDAVKVNYGKTKLTKSINVCKLNEKDIEKIRI